MNTATTQGIEISVESFHLEAQSLPEQDHYVFAYRIRIKNQSDWTVQLISRNWIITDSTGEVKHVQGEGVVGEQPILKPGEEYEYMSGSQLKSPLGTMEGSYQMQTERGKMFDVQIPCFALEVPGVVN